MSIAADGTKVLLNSAMVYFDRFSATGLTTGLRFLGNVTQVEISAAVETKKIYDSTTRERGLLASADTRLDLELLMKMTEFETQKMAIALMGTAGEYLQSSGSVSNQAATAYKDTYIQLADRGIYGGTGITAVVVTGPSGSPTYTVATDYTVDATNGRIYIVPGGAITDGASLEIDYTKPAITTGMIPKVSGADSGLKYGRLQLIGDPNVGPRLVVDVWRCKIAQDGAFPLIGDDFAEFGIKGEILSDKIAHPTDPYYRVMTIGAA